MNINCPNCGKKKEVTIRDIFTALLVEAGAKTSRPLEFCKCSPDISKPKFISGNWLTKDRATQRGDLWFKIWQVHNLPSMGDCRQLNYKYAVVNNRVICEATGDYYDVTDEIYERS